MSNKQNEFEIIKPPGGFSLNLKELWEYRELVLIFIWRDIIAKYKQTILGLVWVLVQPLSMIALFTFFFSGTLKIPTDNIPPPVFYFSGLLIWNFYNAAISNTSNSIVINESIVKKIYFPRIILPFAYVCIALFDFIIAFAIFFVVIIAYEITMPEFDINYFNFIFYPLAILMIVCASFGIGCVFAALNVKFRDVKFMMGFIIQFLFFLTPVIYPVSIFKSDFTEYILAINPGAGAIHLMRSPFVDVPISFDLIFISTISSLILFIIGAYLFKKAEYYFADLI